MGKRNDKIKKDVGGGLLPLPYDERDFSRTAVFGAMRAQDLPTGDFAVAPVLEIKDQGDEDFCTFYATASVSEDQEGVILEPYFNAYVGKVLIQKDPDSWGADLRTACTSHLTPYGALEREFSPFKDTEERPSREQVLSPSTWIEDHTMLAAEHRKNSYFDVLKGSPHDIFDSIRSALWMHRAKMRSVVTGCIWRQSWNAAEKGKVPAQGWEHERGTPHAFKIIGQVFFEAEPHLVAVLSNGEEIGDKGIFYMPRALVNKEFTYGAFMFEDMPPKTAKTYMYYDISVNDSIFVKAWKIFGRIIRDLLKR